MPERDILAKVDQKNVWKNHTNVGFLRIKLFGVLSKLVRNIITVLKEVELVYITVFSLG